MADDDRLTRQQYRQQRSQPTGHDTQEQESPTAEPSASRQAYAAENNRAVEEAKDETASPQIELGDCWTSRWDYYCLLILFLTP